MPCERAVIFDMDGVLVDSADAHRQAWRQLGDEVGVPFTDDLFRRTFGQRNETILPTWLGSVSPESLLDLGDRKEIIYRDLVRHGAVRVYRRIPDLLDALRPNDLFILTSDHGCDPTTSSTDHSREHALLLAYVEGRNADGAVHEGEFADVGATVNAWLGGKAPSRGIPGTPIVEQ